MPRKNEKTYKAGDRLVIYLPESSSEELVKFINSQKYISPTIIDILERYVKEIYYTPVRKGEDL